MSLSCNELTKFAMYSHVIWLYAVPRNSNAFKWDTFNSVNWFASKFNCFKFSGKLDKFTCFKLLFVMESPFNPDGYSIMSNLIKLALFKYKFVSFVSDFNALGLTSPKSLPFKSSSESDEPNKFNSCVAFRMWQLFALNSSICPRMPGDCGIIISVKLFSEISNLFKFLKA